MLKISAASLSSTTIFRISKFRKFVIGDTTKSVFVTDVAPLETADPVLAPFSYSITTAAGALLLILKIKCFQHVQSDTTNEWVVAPPNANDNVMPSTFKRNPLLLVLSAILKLLNGPRQEMKHQNILRQSLSVLDFNDQ